MTKTKRINVRVTEKEYNHIKAKAKNYGKTISAYAREQALERDIKIIDALTKNTPELKRVGEKLNNEVMLAHQGRIKEIDLSEVKKVINNTLESLKELG